MSFISKLWKDRVSDYPNKRKLTKEDGTSETVTVERAEGDIVVAGDAFNAENMNDLETRIQNGFNAVEQAQAELNENLEDAAKKIVVLWTNPEWNSSTNLTPFVAQEIQIDNISDFDMIGICHSAYNNTHNYFNFFLNIFNKENNLTEMFSEVKVTDYYVRLYYRKFIITQSGIKFDIGYSNSHTQVAANNSYAIPVKIIGIKF